MEKKNKYSIRKFTVGTGSIIIGAVMFLSNPAISKASEIDNEELHSSLQQENADFEEQTSKQENADSEEQTPKQENADSEEQTSKQENADSEEQTSKQENADFEEQTSKQENADSEEQTPKQENADSEEQTSKQENADFEEQTSKQENADFEEQTSKQENADFEEQTPKQENADSEEQTSKQENADSEEQTSKQENADSEEQTYKQENADSEEQTPKQENADFEEQTSKQENTDSEEQTSKQENADFEEQTSKQENADSEEQTSEITYQNNHNNKIQILKEHDENINLTKDEYEKLQNKSSKQENTKNTLKTANILSTKVKEESIKENNVTNALGGDNVNDKVKASNVKFTDGTWEKGSLNQIGFDLKISDDVKRNDYFTVKVPKELIPTSADKDNGILLGNDENSIYAKGTYNRENNAFDFKFTDNVEKYKNKTSHLDLMMLINYKETTKTDDYNLNLQVGEQQFLEKRKIEYRSDARNTMVYQDSEIQGKDGAHTPYNTTYTINGQSKNLNNANVKITPYLGNKKNTNVISQFNKNTTKISILKVNDKNSMNQSGSEKNVNTNDESSKHQVTYNSDGSISIDLGNITGPYLITVNSETDRPFVSNTLVESNVQLSANNMFTQNNKSIIGKAKPSNSNSSGVVVDDTTPPTVTPINNQTKEVNTPIDTIIINANDNSGKPVKNDVYGLPEGITFDPETNTISGTPTKTGNYNVIVLSSDHVYNEMKTEFIIKVEDTTAPNLDPVDDQTKEVNTPIDDIQLGGSDNSNGPITHEVSDLPEGITFDAETNTISGTPTKVGNYPITVTTKDEVGNTTETNFTIKVEDTTASDNSNINNNRDASNKENEGHLPDTGEKVENNSLNSIFGGIVAMVGSLLLFIRRKKDKNESHD
ncbi:putative Ig domain-containing protein [Staphylococcus saprophyticus]|nr:putative Ig domain-containing protein [Staphylococcus saprophyticus]